MTTLDAVIVGAGQAGLGVGRFLQRDRHVVLERGRIGESWISQRWDSFKLNTPNLIITSTAPIIAVYPFLQRYFVKGMLVGSIKG